MYRNKINKLRKRKETHKKFKKSACYKTCFKNRNFSVVFKILFLSSHSYYYSYYIHSHIDVKHIYEFYFRSFLPKRRKQKIKYSTSSRLAHQLASSPAARDSVANFHFLLIVVVLVFVVVAISRFFSPSRPQLPSIPLPYPIPQQLMLLHMRDLN